MQRTKPDTAVDAAADPGESARVAPADGPPAERPPRLSVIVPARDCPDYLGRCLEHLRASELDDYELIVVDDASPTDATARVAAEHGARVIRRSARGGPGAARNDGARAARSELLFFVDADVCVRPGTLGRVAAALEAGADGVFGSYDDDPAAPSLVSQYRNLLHHFVHQQGNERATTFWGGAGGLRRACLLEAGGFYEGYGRPCVEDIELGVRLVRQGRSIRLDKGLLVKHLKRWSLWGVLRADFRDRALPWTELILRSREMPNDLNLRLTQRLSAVLALATTLAIGAGAWWRPALLLWPLLALAAILLADLGTSRGAGAMGAWIVRIAAALSLAAPAALAVQGLDPALGIALSGLAALVALNHRLYAFYLARRGPAFATLVVPLQLLYYDFSALAFALGVALHLARGRPAGAAVARVP